MIEVSSEHLAALESLAQKRGVAFSVIGSVGGENLEIDSLSLPLQTLQESYLRGFAKIVENL